MDKQAGWVDKRPTKPVLTGRQCGFNYNPKNERETNEIGPSCSYGINESMLKTVKSSGERQAQFWGGKQLSQCLAVSG